MKGKELIRLGIPKGPAVALAIQALVQARRTGIKKGKLRQAIREVVADPQAFVEDPMYGDLATSLIEQREARATYQPRTEPAPWQQWGTDIDPGACEQMGNACSLPDAVAGVLLPDAHVGYGLPIGGVLATRGVVIPYAVGMDIACRMRMSVFDLPVSALARKRDRLVKAIEQETCFGVGATFNQPRQHAVMDDDWSVTAITEGLRDRAWAQLGTSGAGNHFVDFGILTLDQDPAPEFGLAAGKYLAMLSHSGSRGSGAQIAQHYSKLASSLHPELPRHLSPLAWLAMASEPGQEYWHAMQLMGRYAAANHQLIHEHIASNLGAEVLAVVENHHNFAWREEHCGEPLVIHRKGATPAGRGALGIIPGSMASPAYVVRGRGHQPSLNSAAHGAGRRMSRKAARQTYTWSDAKRVLAKANVTLIAAGLDEVPMAYKDIGTVMTAQQELVEVLARFNPRLVKMAGEKSRGDRGL